MTPIALEHFRGRTFLFSVSDHQPWPWLAAHGQARGRLRAWGSVLTSAFDLGLKLGCDPVAVVGADLAFTGDRPYAMGVAYEEDWRRLADWGVPFESHWRDVMASWPHLEEPDINGAPTRTAAHLVTFRNWLVEQIGREKGRTIVNATEGGILHGPGVPQRPLSDVVASFTRQPVSLRSVVRSRHRRTPGDRLLSAATTLRDEVSDGSSMSPATADVLRAWEGFADGLSRDRIHTALSRGLDGEASRSLKMPAPSRPAEGNFDIPDAGWIHPLATNLQLVWFPVPPVRMEAVSSNTRMFRCRTTAARIIGTAVRMPNPAVTEDGEPLRLAASVDAVEAGEYFIWRDEIRFKSRDGSDPRENGRTYAVLMPRSVAYLEQLPLHVVLEHGL
jgi:hypothetical protein